MVAPPPLDPDDAAVRHRWAESDRYVPTRVVRPLQRFMHTEAAGGIALLVAAVLALVWANSPWSSSYEEVWQTSLAIDLGDLIHLDHLDLRTWVNDGLMAIFFFVAGLEIKREITRGELRDPRAAALPAVAALGGMVVPALIYLAFNVSTSTANGWGIPMATDIAFAVGVLSLLGSRVPPGAKVFLLTLAIADDIGAIAVIAVFYTDELSFGWLVAGLAGLGVMATAKRLDVRAMPLYLGLGLVIWFCCLESGVHATLAGVALGLLTPAWSFYDPQRFPSRARTLVSRVDWDDDRVTVRELEETDGVLDSVDRLAVESRSPLDRLEHGLAPWSAFFVVPVFALANAGVRLDGDTLAAALSSSVALGVGIGLVVGKTLGITLAAALAVGLGVGRLPEGVTWRHVVGLAMIAGIGFTVALFVTELAFSSGAAVDQAKIGILAASTVAGLTGFLWLRAGPSPARTATSVAGARPGRPAASGDDAPQAPDAADAAAGR